MKESYQREEYCSDKRKGALRHFQPPKNLGSNFKAVNTSRRDIRSQFIGLLTKTGQFRSLRGFERYGDVAPTVFSPYRQLPGFH